MPKEKKRDSIKTEQVILAEERTILAYVRTVLSFIGIFFVIAKIYFEEIEFYNPTLLIVLVISVVVLLEEFYRIKKLQKMRKGR